MLGEPSTFSMGADTQEKLAFSTLRTLVSKRQLTYSYITSCKMKAGIASVLLTLACFSSSKGISIGSLDDPYVWSNELVWDSSSKTSLILNYKENGDFSATLRIGGWTYDYAKDMPILAATLSTNVFTEFVYVKYGVGLNLNLVNAVVTGDSKGEFKYLLKNMIVILTDKLALGGTLQGERFDITTFGANLLTFGVDTQDDPEEWRNSILWNEKKPLSFSLQYKSADGKVQNGEVSGELKMGNSEDWSPVAAVAFRNKVSNILNGDLISALSIAAGLHHNDFQGSVTANKTEFKYLFNANIKGDNASVGGLVQGSKATLTNGGLKANLFGTLASLMVNERLDSVKDVTINI
ncbi:hypothetical protein GE061_009434 [Apolygus lucorum]|uniref:Uncharacterized protein n=1 Tax=Apolygus lucorum TaxID=248454 RepID=A0A8S9Y2A6_APOLU|nr:hypothetical protein GE061_009434 [Apolygus lucorum]